MEKSEPKVNKPPTDVKTTQKQPYEAPKATFVPLKLEERLLACAKQSNNAACKAGANVAKHT